MQGMTQHLGDQFKFHIVTLDRDMGDTVPYPNIRRGEWNDVGKAKVLYINSLSDSVLKDMVFGQSWDLVYVQSFFNFRFSLVPLYWWKRGRIKATRALVAPRGEFSKGAITIKPRKKRLYRFALNQFGFFKKVFWHLSSELEKTDLLRELGTPVDPNKIFVASNLAPVRACPNRAHHENANDKLKLLFLSRISPKKNLAFAIELLNQMPEIEIEFNIYGPFDESERHYWELCQTKIESLPKNITVRYHGSVERSQTLGIFAAHDVFLFPTLGENFGHVIFESLLGGCPVICSDQTPWTDMQEFGVGYTIDLSESNKFVDAMLEINSMTPTEQSKQRERCQTYGANVFVKNGTVKANYDMFNQLTQ